MAVTVRVPHGMAWCVEGQRSVVGTGATVRELWQDLSERYPELMWRLSTEAGVPSFWVRVIVDGQAIQQRQGLDTPLRTDSAVALHVLEGAPAASSMGGRGRS